MNLKELKQKVDACFDKGEQYHNLRVCIPNNKGGWGGTSTTTLKYASKGIDWDSGKFILTPEVLMVEKLNSQDKIGYKIKKGDTFLCLKDYKMKYGSIDYTKGSVYKSDIEGSITDNEHCTFHEMEELEDFFEYFKPLDNTKLPVWVKELYRDLQERMKVLEGRKQSRVTEGRIAELQLIIIRVQQILIESINK